LGQVALGRRRLLQRMIKDSQSCPDTASKRRKSPPETYAGERHVRSLCGAVRSGWRRLQEAVGLANHLVCCRPFETASLRSGAASSGVRSEVEWTRSRWRLWAHSASRPGRPDRTPPWSTGTPETAEDCGRLRKIVERVL